MIKKLIFLLIPIIGLCQTSKFTLDDIESIKDYNSFKKVMLERGLKRNDGIHGGYSYNQRGDNLYVGGKMMTTLHGVYVVTHSEVDVKISFSNDDVYMKKEYDNLFDKVKLDCEFKDVNDTNEILEYIFYDCGEGFTIGFGKYDDLLFIKKPIIQ